MVRRCGREHDFRMVQVPVGRFAVVASQEADSARCAVLPGGFAATPSGAVLGKNGITRCLRAALLGYYAEVPSGHGHACFRHVVMLNSFVTSFYDAELLLHM